MASGRGVLRPGKREGAWGLHLLDTPAQHAACALLLRLSTLPCRSHLSERGSGEGLRRQPAKQRARHKSRR